MVEDGLLLGNPESFEELLAECRDLEGRAAGLPHRGTDAVSRGPERVASGL